MRYLRIENLEPNVQLAKPVIGEDGRLLIGAGHKLTDKLLARLVDMGFQGAYIETPGFEDIIIEDVISDELRAKAFDALYKRDYSLCASIAKTMVEEMKGKDTLKLDLLDIKNNRNYDYRHCVSVAVYSIALGIGCGLTEEQLEHLALAGLLHDVGKFDGVRRANVKHICNEKGMDELKKHPMYAYEDLQQYTFISSVTRNSILFHHENLDGTGYYGITGEKLGIFPRILRVADAYDNLTGRNAQGEAHSPAYAIEYLLSNVGTLFDKEVVDVFARDFPVYPNGFTLRLSNGEQVVVVTNSANAQRPIVRKMDLTNIELSTDPDYRSVMIEEMM